MDLYLQIPRPWGTLNTKNWTKTEGTTISTGWAAQWTSKQTSQHHLLWLKLSAARFLKIANSSGWGSTTPSVHDWTLLSIPDNHSYLGRRFPNAVFTHVYPKSHCQPDIWILQHKLVWGTPEGPVCECPAKILEYLQLQAIRVTVCLRIAWKISRSWIK